MGLPLWTLKFTSVFAYFAVHSSAIIPHYDADFSTIYLPTEFYFLNSSRNPVKSLKKEYVFTGLWLECVSIYTKIKSSKKGNKIVYE